MKLLVVFSLFFLVSPAYAVKRCELDKLAEVISANRFRHDRDLEEYEERFPGLRRRLGQLGPRGHVIDAGSGETTAMGQFVGIVRPSAEPDGRAANVTAVTFKLSAEAKRALSGKSPKLDLLTERFLSDISASELTGHFGKADVILDFWGILAYTNDLGGDLQKYVAVAKPGAEIYLTVGPREFDYRSGFGRVKSRSSMYRSVVRRADGGEVSVPDWIRSLPGLHVTETAGQRPQHTNFVITVADPSRVRVPRLRLVSSDTGVMPPPARVFEEY